MDRPSGRNLAKTTGQAGGEPLLESPPLPTPQSRTASRGPWAELALSLQGASSLHGAPLTPGCPLL